MTVYLIEHLNNVGGVATWGNGSSDDHRYATGKTKPNYPMPAIQPRSTFQSLCNLGYMSALNNFDVDTVFETWIKR